MPDFQYEAMGTTGQRSQGTLTANNEREVLTMLDARGLFPLNVQPAKSKLGGRTGGARIRSRHMATFYSQLADLLRAGVPLLRSVEILERQTTHGALAEILRDVRDRVTDGTSLADSMAHYPKTFNELAVSMVRAGEEGGFLEDVLERIAEFTEHQEDLKAKVIGALAYPVFLAVAGFTVLNILVIFFVPQFEPIFARLEEKGEMPFLTKALIAFSHFMQNYWWLLIVPGVVLYILYHNWSNTDSGRRMVDAVKLRIPGAGKIYLSLAIARFTRILGTLLHNGIPILQALKIAKDSTGNRVITEAIDQAGENITQGDQLATPFGECKYFPRDVVEMVAVGEESNNLENVLVTIADSLEKRTSRQLELFVRLLEPVMLLVMAGITLLVVAGLLLPIFKMSSTVR